MTDLAAGADFEEESKPEDGSMDGVSEDSSTTSPGGGIEPAEESPETDEMPEAGDGPDDAETPEALEAPDDAETPDAGEEPEVAPHDDDTPSGPDDARDETGEAPDEAHRANEQAAEGASEAAGSASQDALFSTDLPPTLPVTSDEGVTVFGGPADDLAAIRAELGAESEGPVEPAEAVAAVAAAGAAADEEAVEAVSEAGAPEGADDDPEAVEALLDAEAEAGVAGDRRDHLLSVPFLVYLAVWLVFSVAMVLVLREAATSGGPETAPSYPLFVLLGLALTVLGPVLTLAVWLVKRSRTEPLARVGLFSSAALRGALATFGGVVMWWIALIVLNYMKTGRYF